MVICGIKVTHDGGVAVVDGGVLRFSVEMEKLGGNVRHSTLGCLDNLDLILKSEGISPMDVDAFVVDGWFGAAPGAPVSVATSRAGSRVELRVADYQPPSTRVSALTPYRFDNPALSPRGTYTSYFHASNHVFGSYCTSPFAERGEDSLVLVWDGGMLPRLFSVSASDRSVTDLGPQFPLLGNMFSDFCARLAPFRRDWDGMDDEEKHRTLLEVPGKAMAYAALGTVEPDAFAGFDTLLDELNDLTWTAAARFGEGVLARRDDMFAGLTDADLIATFQAYIGELLLGALRESLRKIGGTPNLCLGGGCALNIKWNAAVRGSGMFADVWVPPFPNDSGAAIGTACCEMFRAGRHAALDWQVYAGPQLGAQPCPPGWNARACDEEALAELLYRHGEPVAVLTGRAELGPRALGNRSIIAPAVDPAMKSRLNAIKKREHYRPVAPICLERYAPEVFDPGTPDPYMLFEHRVRPQWIDKVPAITHLDGTARLQTVNDRQNPPIARVLNAYHRRTGVPLLCNTSANGPGQGFFPDLPSAASWGGVRLLWADGTLYKAPDAPSG
ncbi:carbamoyltransferase N-terminal domain-containing protein [Actinomadura fulvescens]|uniref:Carbamoyltransferase n=1 Tax=Actinomadura fulvescens TaxID=46160 RepID=A0ABP6D3V4_9ACTN